MTTDARIRDEAIDWRIRLAGGGAADWESFVDWLERSPEHARAYDLVARAEADAAAAMAQAPALPEPANDPGPLIARRRRLYGFAALAAAALVVLVGAPEYLGSHADFYQVRTGPGEQRTVRLPDSGEVALNGNSVLQLDRSNPRYAALEQGEARFSVRHDTARPFRVVLGDDLVEDVGTVFDVVRDRSGNRVEVAEGKIVYNPSREAVALAAGQTLTDPANGAIVRGERAPSAIGAWHEGRLSYDGAPIARVAADLARSTGAAVSVSPALADRNFSGTIRLDQDQDRLFAHVEALMGVKARRNSGGWQLIPASGEAR